MMYRGCRNAPSSCEPQVSSSPRNGRRNGAAAVEFAVVAPLFFFFILGIFEFGRALMVMELLNEAARVGARIGVIEGSSNDKINQAVVDFLNNVTVGGATSKVSVSDAVGNTVEAKDVPPYTQIRVTVTVSANDVSWVPNAVFPGGTLTGQATMRRE